MSKPMSAERLAEIRAVLTQANGEHLTCWKGRVTAFGYTDTVPLDLPITPTDLLNLLAEVERLTAAHDVDVALCDLLRDDFADSTAEIERLSTVTDEMVERAAVTLGEAWAQINGGWLVMDAHRQMARAALTAALASARGDGTGVS